MSTADTTKLPEPDPDATSVLPEDSFMAETPVAGADLSQALAGAQARADEQRDLYLRALADLENFRKRAQRDVEQAHKFGLERFAQELLGVADSLEAAQGAATGSDPKALLEGQKATLRLLQAAFQKYGIQQIDPAGAPFDPQQHEAMAMQESGTAEPDSVLQVVQKGYQLNGRLLRPARVIVARAPAEKDKR